MLHAADMNKCRIGTLVISISEANYGKCRDGFLPHLLCMFFFFFLPRPEAQDEFNELTQNESLLFSIRCCKLFSKEAALMC